MAFFSQDINHIDVTNVRMPVVKVTAWHNTWNNIVTILLNLTSLTFVWYVTNISLQSLCFCHIRPLLTPTLNINLNYLCLIFVHYKFINKVIKPLVHLMVFFCKRKNSSPSLLMNWLRPEVKDCVFKSKCWLYHDDKWKVKCIFLYLMWKVNL